MSLAKVQSSRGWQTQRHYCLGVSLGSHNHQGDALAAIVDWINRQEHFVSGIIDLSDTLHRFNIMMDAGLSEAAARQEAARISSEWCQRHWPILRTLKVPFEYITWDHWLSDGRFEIYKHAFEESFRSGGPLADAIRGDVNAYFKRRFGHGIETASAHKTMLCVSYLIEELSAHSILYQAFPNRVTIYPGRQQRCYALVREGGLPDTPRGLCTSLHVRLVIHGRSVTP